jgi:hypothetical protein
MKIWTTILLFTTSVSLFGQASQELKYLKTRDSYIEYFKKMTTKNPDWTKVDRQNNDSLLVLEKLLKEILKNSIVKGGKINLETLVGELGFGNLDGLVLNKNNVVRDSTQVFVTTKTLFLEYFKKAQINSIDNLSKEQLDDIFTSAFGGGEAHATTFSIVEKTLKKDSQTYGCIGSFGQESGEAAAPDCIFVLASKGIFIYIFLEYLDTSIIELRECKSTSDSLYSQSHKYEKLYDESNPKDKSLINKAVDFQEVAWKQYCECYQNNLKDEAVFDKIRNQVIKVMQYDEK